ncbi:MAG: hypothetical protein IPI30_19540 [Saprospiraceae bacterium]|nr:hypothetical protein [Candidatus Vicinibacter affinis]
MANFKDYKAPKPTIFEKFLWWCCGADKQIMVESTYADYAKYSGLGELSWLPAFWLHYPWALQ